MDLTFNDIEESGVQNIRKKRIYLSSATINSAREKLLSFQRVQEEEGVEKKEVEKEEEEYTRSREITIKEDVLLEEYLHYCNNDNVFTLVHMYLHDGKIKIYEVPSSPYSYVAGGIITLMARWNSQDFLYGTNTTMIVGQNSARDPNISIIPINRPRPQQDAAADNLGNAYPTMVAEIGFSQSLPDLHRTATLYFNQRTTVQIVLIIKIFPVHTIICTITHTCTTCTVALIAALYLRTSPTPTTPTIVISFGTGVPNASTMNYITGYMGVPPSNFIGVGHPNSSPCNAANIPTYTINIPRRELFDRVPQNLRPQGFAAGFDLDLWEIQTIARHFLNI